jgi:hypothetical protein
MTMQQYTIGEATERIRRMEICFDILQEAAEDDEAVCAEKWFTQLLGILRRYYENGQWLRDYELDETGLLPQNLKRGVLAQDAVYDFLERIKNFTTNQ